MNKSSSSNFPLGYTLNSGQIFFRLFAPDVISTEVIIYQNYEDEEGIHIPLQKNEEGIWEGFAEGDFIGKWYAYQIERERITDPLMKIKYPVADPWSKHVTSRNHHLQYPKTKIVDNEAFDWEDDTFQAPKDPRDLVIYEAHIKDMVAHKSAKTYVQGIYNDFLEAEVGGLNHLKKLGVNAVEFLPLQKFGYFEPPFDEETEEGVKNTWNPFARNYWGYMTSFYFVPETIYASDGSTKPDAIVGASQTAATELKKLVKALHKAGISVIMDVVYNHASHYDLNPLKLTAREHYFRLDEKGNYLSDSWTGNDINTSAKYSRKIIVESIKYWMREFHIDGFRFDLAGMIDWETVDEIKKEAQEINPNVLLIAEPWGGEYKPDGFSDHGWSSWNDRFRNYFKGYDPQQDHGYIFGNWNPDYSRFAIENLIRGTLAGKEHGLFKTSQHSVNYLESHDGYTLGDYIRIALKPKKAEKTFKDKLAETILGKSEMKVAKLAALSLFVSQGIPMIHAGQEWARTKIVHDPTGKDPKTGKFDHDSYNKDNETNWLNFDEIALNEDLYKYYKGLIALRLSSPALRKAKPEEVHFKVYQDPLHVTFSIDGKSTEDMYDYFVSLNANVEHDYINKLPEGNWEMVANSKKTGTETIKSIQHEYKLTAGTGVILRKLRVNKA